MVLDLTKVKGQRRKTAMNSSVTDMSESNISSSEISLMLDGADSKLNDLLTCTLKLFAVRDKD